MDELDFVDPIDIFVYAALLWKAGDKGSVVTIGSRLTPFRVRVSRRHS